MRCIRSRTWKERVLLVDRGSDKGEKGYCHDKAISLLGFRMGLDWHGVKFLCDMRRRGVEFSRVVTIGRLNLYCPMPKVRQIFDEYKMCSIDDKTSLSTHQYAEPIFNLLGATSVDSIDASAYEQASIILDMNKPISAELHERFDLVYDGGTLEHVFNLPQALKNEMSMAKVGGHVVIHTMANNFFGHGFYQLSPELFYRAFSPENGFRVERLIVAAGYEFAEWYDIPDPAQVRGRIELANAWDGIVLLVQARRERAAPIFEHAPQQSDYSMRWDRADTTVATDILASAGIRSSVFQKAKQTAKQAFPWALRAKHRLMWAIPTMPRLFNRRKHRQERQGFSVQAQPHKFKRVN
jgi:hypothetical protein